MTILFSPAVLIAGVVSGIIGSTPMLVAVALVSRKRVAPSVGKGLAAVAVSFAFLMAELAACWALASEEIVALIVGMLVGYFAMLGALAFLAMTNRL